MATALVGSPTNASADPSERQFTNELQQQQQQQIEPAAPAAEALQATREMCAYCFGRYFLCDYFVWRGKAVRTEYHRGEAGVYVTEVEVSFCLSGK